MKALLGRWAPLTGVVTRPWSRVSQVTICDVLEKGRTFRQMAKLFSRGEAWGAFSLGEVTAVDRQPFGEGAVEVVRGEGGGVR